MTSTIQSFVPSTDRAVGEAFCTSGTSPTVHLIGPGQVGQAFLRQLPDSFRLIGITDSSATRHARDGLAPQELAAFKGDGGCLRDLEGAEVLPLDLALDFVDADLVVDATPTGFDSAASTRRTLRLLRHGKHVALASKDALCSAATELLDAQHRQRVGIHAVLGGTGATLSRDLDELRRECEEVALVGNASTTAVIEVIECGHTIEAGITQAQRRGVLEPDPELDLSGVDAATKLAAVAGALWSRTPELRAITREHLRDLDVAAVRDRARDGQTTRLVARGRADGFLRVAYEALPRHAALAVPATHVAYQYTLRDGSTRVHTGVGIGPDRTAAALLQDVVRFAGRVVA